MRRPSSRSFTIGLVAALVSVALVSLSPPTEADATTTSRVAGPDRFATSVEISRAMPWTGTTVFLASGSKFPDALTAGPVAAAEQAHLLLTRRDELPPVVMDELRRLSPSQVVLVGDANSISESVAAAVRTATGARTERVAGGNRYETAQRLLQRLGDSGPITEIWVVAGSKFPDALVAGSIAGQVRGGIVLDPNRTAPADIDAWMRTVEPIVEGIPVRIAGSSASVSSAAEAALRQTGASAVDRYAGGNRYETARAIHDAFSASVPSGRMLLTTGQNFPDALGGSLMAAHFGEPLYLTPTACNDAVATMLRGERDERGIGHVLGLGGVPSLSERALRLENCPPPPPSPSPSPSPQPPSGPPPSASVNCTDFGTWAAAQAWFTYWYPTRGDVAGLDADGDMIACESLPGAP